MSDKICLPTEHHFLLMITFLLLTMFYIYNLGSMQNIDHNNGLNNNLVALSEKLRKLDTVPLIQNQPVVKKPVKKRMSKEDIPLNRRIWCNEEDEAIKQLVNKYGNNLMIYNTTMISSSNF